LAVDVLTEITIRRPCAEVADYAADPHNAPTWYENIESIEWRTDPPLAVGSEIEFVARFMGRRLTYTYRVAEFARRERLVMKTSEGPFPMETTYTWTASDETSTRMTLRNRGGATGALARVFSPIESFMVRRATRKDLARLGTILESRKET
jgi:Polyketide cyclase / dehydrase and lipid transport